VKSLPDRARQAALGSVLNATLKLPVASQFDLLCGGFAALDSLPEDARRGEFRRGLFNEVKSCLGKIEEVPDDKRYDVFHGLGILALKLPPEDGRELLKEIDLQIGVLPEEKQE
jgi:hypothetical protein